MSAPPTYRAQVRHAEQERIREREAAGKCMACGKAPAAPPSKLCAEHLTDLDRHRDDAAQNEALHRPLATPVRTPRVGERRRNDP